VNAYNKALRRADVEALLDTTGYPYGYTVITPASKPYIVWSFTSSEKVADDSGKLRTSTDTLVVELYATPWSEEAEDVVLAALETPGDDISIERDYIDTEDLWVTIFTVTHTGKIGR
jgi:hypothetical protein